MEADNKTNPINLFCSCEDCGAEVGEECDDCRNHSSRIHYFMANAPLKNRIQAQNWTHSRLPDSALQDSLFLRREEFVIWKKLKLGDKINYTTLNHEVK